MPALCLVGCADRGGFVAGHSPGPHLQAYVETQPGTISKSPTGVQDRSLPSPDRVLPSKENGLTSKDSVAPPLPGEDRQPSDTQPGTSQRNGTEQPQRPEESTANAQKPPRVPESSPVVDRYVLRPGDRLELLYTDQWPIDGEYRLLPGDRLRIEYLHLLTADQTESSMDRVVQVQPDGKLSLPLIGMTVATGKTVADLTQELNRRYEEFYVEPQMHVSLETTGNGLKGLWESLRSTGGRLVTVAPDGVIGVPFLGPVPAAGLTVAELQEELQSRYTKVARNLSVTVRLARPSSAPSIRSPDVSLNDRNPAGTVMPESATSAQ